MAKMVRRSIRLAQNFLHSPRLAAAIVAQAQLSKKDIVYETGPGEGILTRELAKACGRVVAVEIDRQLFGRLTARFRHLPHVELHHGDFLKFAIRHARYKVVADIPYNRTAAILHKLLRGGNPPAEAHLVVQKEAGEKYAGVGRERQCSLLLKPWFALAVVRHLRRSDFRPVPGVDSVLLRIGRRGPPLVAAPHAELYRRLVTLGFSGSRANLRQSLKRVFTPTQWRRLARDLGFGVRARPGELRFEQWLGLFEFLVDRLPRSQAGPAPARRR